MPKIVLNNINIVENKVIYDYWVSDDIKKYFNVDNEYYLEYNCMGNSIDLSNVPQSILVVPFMCNFIPIVWMTGAEINISEIDLDFYESIDKFKKGYMDMYPEATFKGEIIVDNIVCNKIDDKQRCGMFFSAGLDAYCTLANHFEEKPDLITIWGSDINVNNVSGWEVLEKLLRNVSEEYDLPLITIRSSFRDVVNCNELSKKFEPILHDEWWHGMQHGPAIIGHAAPISYLRGYKRQYIASSYCSQDGFITCASYPSIDNNISYCGCNVIHDGFEFTRQEKAKVIYNFYQKYNKLITLHVCWRSSDGNNCCKCEKCLRTIAELAVLGANPADFGFKCDFSVFKYMKNFILYDTEINHLYIKFWIQIQNEFLNNKKLIKCNPYYHYMRWIEKVDFNNYDNAKVMIIKWFRRVKLKFNRLIKM